MAYEAPVFGGNRGGDHGWKGKWVPGGLQETAILDLQGLISLGGNVRILGHHDEGLAEPSGAGIGNEEEIRHSPIPHRAGAGHVAVGEGVAPDTVPTG